MSCKECAGQGKSLRVATQGKVLKTTAVGVRRVKRLQHLDKVEGLPQGVRTRSSQKDLISREQAQEE